MAIGADTQRLSMVDIVDSRYYIVGCLTGYPDGGKMLPGTPVAIGGVTTMP